VRRLGLLQCGPGKTLPWVADPDKIIVAVRRGHQALDSIHYARSPSGPIGQPIASFTQELFHSSNSRSTSSLANKSPCACGNAWFKYGFKETPVAVWSSHQKCCHRLNLILQVYIPDFLYEELKMLVLPLLSHTHLLDYYGEAVAAHQGEAFG
jgi:hypothetical protein